MRSSSRVLEMPDFRVDVVQCFDGPHDGWSAPEQAESAGIVLPQSGMFRIGIDGRRQTADPTTGYVRTPGSELRFAHPAGGDVCTYISVHERLWDEAAGPDVDVLPIAVDARLELAHRLLLRTDRDAADPAERLVHMVTAAVSRSRTAPPVGNAVLADRAREAVVANHPDAADLVRLARLLRVSPAHLSRTFSAHVGMSLTRYRNRVRVSRILAAIEDGETDLSALAVTVGFADQAHLTRTVRAELGHTPGRLRDLLRRGG